MLRIFSDEISNPKNFVVTLELVPGRESFGQSIDTLKGIAKDAFDDGRICAVSITDNPGGNPSLSPDVLGYEIFKYGMDVIVHFTCRDMNRVGMESRALQLARMGMKNILALTGDYSGKGFGGQGKPVFDFDSVLLTTLLKSFDQKRLAGDPDLFFTGCAVSPFKTTEAETFAQYNKLDKKLDAGASFVITQLGYDVKKFKELITHLSQKQMNQPVMGSVYLLSPRSARAMNRGRVPGAHVPDTLFKQVIKEWGNNPRSGLKTAIDRAAKLGVILKGLGYRGIHIGGIQRSFKAVGAILDRMEEIEDSWEDYLGEFNRVDAKAYYCFDNQLVPEEKASEDKVPEEKVPWASRIKQTLTEHSPHGALKAAHNLFFDKTARLAPVYGKLAGFLEKNNKAWLLKLILEDPLKKPLLSCQSCGDCAIQHTAFLCPESGCPKHTRNGACGGSRDGFCEVNPDRSCVWVRAYKRLKHCGMGHTLGNDFVPPRMWELNKGSSWVNFHLGKDHQKD